MELPPTAATVSAWSASSPGCALDTLFVNAVCILVSRVVAPLRWSYVGLNILDTVEYKLCAMTRSVKVQVALLLNVLIDS